MLGFVGFAAVVGYVFSPQILALGSEPVYFVFNLRYVSSALVLGLVLLPVVPAFNAGRRAWWVLGAFALVLGAIQLDPSIWETGIFGLRLIEPIRGGDSIAGLLVGAAVLLIGVLVLVRGEWVRERWLRVAALAVVGLLVVVGGFALERAYLRDRYRSTGPPLASWARDVSDERIAIAGPYAILVQYPLYGKDLSNYVQFVGRKGPHGAFDPFRDCAAWRRSLDDGRYSYAVVFDETGQRLEALWTRSDPAATLVTDGQSRMNPWYRVFRRQFPKASLSLFRIHGRLDPAGCENLPKNQRTIPTAPHVADAT